MKKVLVTGAAGFIGSHLVDKLLSLGCEVVGIDGMLPNYPRTWKENNLRSARKHSNFHWVEKDIMDVDAAALLSGVDVVFHLAGQPGVRKSWGEEFALYLRNNVAVTQRLLEAAAKSPIKKFVYASTSSVYGNVPTPMREDGPTRPISPYGVTKLAAEHLCYLYAHQFGVPTVSLRYFTVYGPRQRPDMAFHRFIQAALAGQPLTIFGAGKLKRDFTFVDDVVYANLLAAERGRVGEVYNIGGGAQVSLQEVLIQLEQALGQKLQVNFISEVPHGDMVETLADISKATEELGYTPKTRLIDGLRAEIEWLKSVEN